MTLGFLEKMERGLERVVNGAFSKAFKSDLQPVEIAAAIRAEMDSRASILSRERILAPNTYTVHLSAPDFERMQSLGQPLITELTDLAVSHARAQGFQFGAALGLALRLDSALALGQVRVVASSQELEIEWTPALEVAGKLHQLTQARTSVGRDPGADIPVADPGLSRKHFEILWDGKRAGIRDLGSTNGTRILGRPVVEGPLPADTLIEAGRSQFIFRVVARTVVPGE